MRYEDVVLELRRLASPEKAKASSWFFKTGPGQYGEGDKFLGLTVPQQRQLAKKFKDLSLNEVEKLIISPWHEERLTGLFILVLAFEKGDRLVKQQIFDFYLSHTAHVNNWDLVDSSAPYIVGEFLHGHPDKMGILTKLAKSDSLWEKRIAVLATYYFIRQGSSDEALHIIDIVSQDTHDLLQKACGWMLREIGKRVGRPVLLTYLDTHARTMPRIMLRYAIEHLEPKDRTHYLSLKG